MLWRHAATAPTQHIQLVLWRHVATAPTQHIQLVLWQHVATAPTQHVQLVLWQRVATAPTERNAVNHRVLLDYNVIKEQCMLPEDDRVIETCRSVLSVLQ